ncbi:MAG: hypothetical protein ACRDPH_10790 [Marmoricola sp.]
MAAPQSGNLRAQALGLPTDERDLQAFLARRGLVVRDVARGAAPGTRRLAVGTVGAPRPTAVVSVPVEAAGSTGVDDEVRHVRELRRRLRPAMRDTVPSVLELIVIGENRAAVLSPAPGKGAEHGTDGRRARSRAVAVLAWLTMLWEDTAGPPAPVSLGRDAYDTLLARFARTQAAATTLGVLHRSRSALVGRHTPRTVSHGCLCPRHVRIGEGRVTEVDDWGVSRLGADPLCDLGGWVVATAGQRIEAVIDRDSRMGRSLHGLLAEGLRLQGLPASLWREVLVLSLAESAVAGLARDDAAPLDLLARVSRKLSGNHRQDGVMP